MGKDNKALYTHDDQKRLANNISKVPRKYHEKIYEMLTDGTKKGEKCFQVTSGGMHINLKAIETTTLKRVDAYVQKILKKEDEIEEEAEDEMVDHVELSKKRFPEKKIY